jgi:curli production assembly/transport component CsgF
MKRNMNVFFARCVAYAGMTCLSIAPAMANDLVYQPVNPSFGGNPLNGSYLLSQASANNFKFLTNPASQQAAAASTASAATTSANAIKQFQSEITSSLLSQIAYQVSQEIIGVNAKDSGTFNLNGEIIQFNRNNGQVNINITDAASGATTNIQIPVPTF